MRRLARAISLLPLVLVAGLAIGLAIAGRISTHDSVTVPSTATRTLSSPSPTAGDPTASPTATATPTATPTTTPSPTSSANANDAVEMLRVHNELRGAVGAPAVREDRRVTTAAQRHAEYLAQNNALGHDETVGAPGFTGASVRDRLDAQGYTDANASEVATSFGSGTDGVRSLWVLPYHRLGLMHPHAVVAGWGHAVNAGRTVTVGVIVYDFAAQAPDRVRTPAADQRVAGTYSGEEVPEVLPSGAARPVGYPIMVVYSGARPVDLRNARITDANGRDLAYHVVPQLYERDYVAIIPATPLAPGTRFRVRLDLSVAGGDVTEEWEFESER
ncbi:MAG TPA: CAP domain-containing protein [Candidatus Limnocylindria bacterium]|nr:CAP domain-containing protein [Candidatus Limnocylindria bacterium]